MKAGFSLHGLIVMLSATVDENVKKKRTQHLGAQMELLPYVYFFKFAYPLRLDCYAYWLMGGSLPKTRTICEHDTI
jgi:hypothetical protein